MAREAVRSIIGAGLPKASQVTPLVIILSFVLLTEVVVMIGVLGTKEWLPQLMLTGFCVGFPVFIAVPFFWILSKTPWVFYAPRDYGDSIDPEKYISAISSQRIMRVTDNTNRLINDLPQVVHEALRSETVRSLISMGAGKPVEKIAESIVSSIATVIEKNEVIRVDLSYFKGEVVQIPASKNTFIGDLLDIIWLEINRTQEVPAFAYGRLWILENSETGEKLLDMGANWARRHGRDTDDRLLEEKNMAPGMLLKAVSADSEDRRYRGRIRRPE